MYISSSCLTGSEIKDQGFTRPRALLLVPFKNSAYEIVKLIIELAPKIQQVSLHSLFIKTGKSRK